MDDNKELTRARNYASILLKVRARSEEELRFRLKEKNFSPAVINELVASFRASGYLNDWDFARAWVRERVNKPLGFTRLEFELKEKGIAKAIIDDVLAQAKKDYPERKTIDSLIEKKFTKILNKLIDDKTRHKIQGYLLGRGFDKDAVIEAVEELK